MLNKKEIRDKKKYINERLKRNISNFEKEKLESTLISLMLLEVNNDNIKNNKLNKFIEEKLKGHSFLKPSSKFKKIMNDVINTYSSPINNEYLSFLLEITRNLGSIEVTYDDDANELSPFSFTDEEVITLAKKFYENLEDEDILKEANKIINYSSHFGFTDTFFEKEEIYYGLTYYDTIFNKPYMTIQRTNNLMEFQTFNHEVMHGIDFYLKPKIPSQIYYGFHEIPTYTIDYLFQDFLESNNFDKNDIDALRRKKYQYVQLMAQKVLFQIRHKLNQKIGMKNALNASIEQIKSVIDEDLLKDMLELVSCVVANGLYKQIKTNKEYGLNNLKYLMKNPFSKNAIPDFTIIGLDNKKLLELSKEMEKEISYSLDNKK